MRLTMITNVRPEGWSVDNMSDSVTALLLAAFSIVLLVVVISALWREKGPGAGDYSKNAKIVFSILIILSILPIGMGSMAVASGYGAAMLNVVNSLFGFGG